MSEELKGFDALLADGEAQAEFDRRVNKAIEAARDKWEENALARIEAARAEGARAAGMSAEEKLQARERALSGRERALSQRELRAKAARALSERGLPGELADAINCEDPGAYEASFERAEAAFRAAVQAGIAQRLGGAAPSMGIDRADPSKLTDDQYYAGKF